MSAPQEDDPTEKRQQWLDRAHAVARAQARLLWVTLIAAVFFFALKSSPSPEQVVTVPVLGIELDALSVLAVGPLILSLLLIASMGSMMAWQHAIEEYAGRKWTGSAAHLDQSPTLLDFVLQTTEGGPRVVAELVRFVVYPGYLTVVLVETIWLYAWLYSSQVSGRVLLLGVAGLLILGATYHVLRMFWSRGVHMWRAFRTG